MFKKFIIRQLALLSVVFLFSGCVYLIIGGMGALGGYVVSPDTVEGVTNHDMSTVWSATVDVVGIMGIIEDQSKESGILIAKVNGSKVTITLTTINQKNVKINVKARKAFFPKISAAQDVFVKVMSSMNE